MCKRIETSACPSLLAAIHRLTPERRVVLDSGRPPSTVWPEKRPAIGEVPRGVITCRSRIQFGRQDMMCEQDEEGYKCCGKPKQV